MVLASHNYALVCKGCLPTLYFIVFKGCLLALCFIVLKSVPAGHYYAFKVCLLTLCFIVFKWSLPTFYFNLQKVFGNHVLNRHPKVLPNAAFYSIQNVVFKPHV
jgi:hypothetical protein